MSVVTYGETCAWAVWMRSFTPSQLANSMGVEPEVIEGHILGLLFNGTIEDTGAYLNGKGPPEPVYTFVPLPPGPREHPHYVPEWRMVAGCYSEILSPRGRPVRIRTERSQRQGMSTPGQRQKMRMAEKRYKRQQETVAEREEKRRIKHAQQAERRTDREVRAIEKAKRRKEKKAREVI